MFKRKLDWILKQKMYCFCQKMYFVPEKCISIWERKTVTCVGHQQNLLRNRRLHDAIKFPSNLPDRALVYYWRRKHSQFMTSMLFCEQDKYSRKLQILTLTVVSPKNWIFFPIVYFNVQLQWCTLQMYEYPVWKSMWFTYMLSLQNHKQLALFARTTTMYCIILLNVE